MTTDKIILSIETSLRQGSLALLRGTTQIGHWSGNESVSRSEDLVLGIGNMLVENNLRLVDLDYLVVSTGPGSFTGLRVGIAAAKGLSFATNKTLVGLTILETLAFAAFQELNNFQNNDVEIISIVGAGGEFFYVQKFSEFSKEFLWKKETPIKIVLGGEFVQELCSTTSISTKSKQIIIVTESGISQKLNNLVYETVSFELLIIEQHTLAKYIGLLTDFQLKANIDFDEVVPIYVRSV